MDTAVQTDIMLIEIAYSSGSVQILPFIQFELNIKANNLIYEAADVGDIKPIKINPSHIIYANRVALIRKGEMIPNHLLRYFYPLMYR